MIRKIFSRKPILPARDSRTFLSDVAITKTLNWWVSEGQQVAANERYAEHEAWKLRQIPIANL